MRLPDGEYWMYLRKSRADIEAEARGEGETLTKHKNALFRLARDYNINVTKVYQEIASGESILHRPEMVRMLKEIETEFPKGILVMDYDRLGRGDKIDQGIIERTFKECDTLIITPSEVLDLNSESGEFNAEVRGFLARMELKQITKRMQGGRQRSVESGNYIGTLPPYGYEIHKDEIGRTLKPHPQQSLVVRLIFDLYVNHQMGSRKIANELNHLKKPSYTGKHWEGSAILNILKNQVYIGRIQWKKTEAKKSKEAGKKRTTRHRDPEEWIDVKGRHEPLIDEVTFKRAQEKLQGRYHVPYQLVNGITNPLAGLIKCELCGATMVLRPYTNQLPHLICANNQCSNKSSRFEFVERNLIAALEDWLKQYKLTWKNRTIQKTDLSDHWEITVHSLKKELSESEHQVGNLHDLLERGIYDEDTYLQRSQVLSERIKRLKEEIKTAEEKLQEESKKTNTKDLIPKMENAIKVYKKEKDPAIKNEILKSVLSQATYQKEKHQRNDEFTLRLLPKLQ